ncbi:MAG: septation protein SepH [Actinomycetota bacterium]
MSPREIQARVRAGASPEVVASETGWPLDKVTRYAEPPLGERAYMAEQARDVEISRSRGGSTLHQSVCTRLSVDPEGTDVTWDSYRADDGRWVVTAYHAHRGVGTWYYEAVGRTVHPADASARALMGGGPTEVADDAPPPPAPVSTPTPPADANEQSDTTTDDEPHPAPRPRLVSITSDPTSDPTPAPTSDEMSAGETVSDTATPATATAQDTLIPEDAGAPKRAKRTKSKRGRASVPSWDEILFGATKDSE